MRDWDRLIRGEIRIISSKRARKLRRRGVSCWYSCDVGALVWDSEDMGKKQIRGRVWK